MEMKKNMIILKNMLVNLFVEEKEEEEQNNENKNLNKTKIIMKVYYF